jgi:hypothetical protein
MHAMDTSRIAVATITWARTAAEEDRLCRSLERLAGMGFPVAVADAGTNREFAEFLTRLPGFRVTVPPARGLFAQVTASLGLAETFDTPLILYTEPDKECFFGKPCRDFTARAADPRDGGELGVALASRSDESFSTYPPMQRYTEGVINRLCGELLGRPGDYSYGPFLLGRALLPHLLAAGSDLGWGWRHFAFRSAHRLGLRLVHVTGDYPCPPDQRVEVDAERTHRLRQLSENIQGLIAQP